MNPLEGVLSGLLVSSLIFGGYKTNEASNMTKEFNACKVERDIVNLNHNNLLFRVNELNAITEAQRIDYEKRIKEFEPVTVTRTVTVYVPKEVNVTRGDCNDTNVYIDYIRTNGI